MDDVVVVAVVGRGGLKAGVLRLGAGRMRSGGMVGWIGLGMGEMVVELGKYLLTCMRTDSCGLCPPCPSRPGMGERAAQDGCFIQA